MSIIIQTNRFYVEQLRSNNKSEKVFAESSSDTNELMDLGACGAMGPHGPMGLRVCTGPGAQQGPRVWEQPYIFLGPGIGIQI